MLLASQIAAILGLLLAFGVPQPTVDTVSLILNHQATTTMIDNTDVPNASPFGTGAPGLSQNATTTSPLLNTVPSKAHIEIVSPIAGKGLGPRIDKVTGADVGYRAAAQIVDESNYIELGAILYDAEGQPVSTEKVTITATDSDQEAIEVGTGNVMTIWPNGERRQVPVYKYHYEFKTAGEHTITFTSAGGLTVSVTVTAK